MELDRRRPLFLLTHPRTASNLLVRILALDEQPNVLARKSGGYFFLPRWLLDQKLRIHDKHVEEWAQDERDQKRQNYQACFDDLQNFLDKAKFENKIAFVKDHCYHMTEPTAQARFLFGPESVKKPPWTVQVPGTYGSLSRSSLDETVLPDELLKTWRPIFLIRHPALVFPSYYHTVIDLQGQERAKTLEAELDMDMTLHWMRTLYDFYAQQPGTPGSGSESEPDTSFPLVLDADDVMTEPAVLVRFCELVGLDPAKLRFSWEPAGVEESGLPKNDTGRRFLSTLLASGGIVKEKTSAGMDLDISAEAEKWKEEFGEREGERMEKWVRAAMPDYDYMEARRLRPKVE